MKIQFDITEFFFVLGFLAYLALGKSHEECIQAGAYCAFECIQQYGCTFLDKSTFDPTTFVV
jgi:sugar/nucleoside kinase (ribokinase family)